MNCPQIVGSLDFNQAERRNPTLLAVPPIPILLAFLVSLVCSICLAPLSGYAAAAASGGRALAKPTITHGGYPSVLAGGPALAATAARDTVYILGGPDRPDGKFQDPESPALPDPQGWAGWTEWPDPSLPDSYWHIDTFNAELLDPDHDPNHAMWCGMVFDTCDPPNPGYGNSWDESLEWYGTVSEMGTLASLTARLNYDTEPDYDNLYLELERADGWDVLLSYDGNNRVGGIFVPVDVEVTFEVFPEDLVGPDQNQMHLRWHFVSDGGWSDEDCQYDTDGAAQIDNIAVYLGDLGAPELLTFDDFQPGSDMYWIPVSTSTECSYAQVWGRLYDLDTCHENSTPQFAFVDNGEQCGGPGSPGIIWTYGPGGYVIHYDQDIPFPLLETDEVWSPPLAWPEGDYDSAILAFDVYEHNSDGGQFTTWAVRTSSDDGTTWGSWADFNFFYYHPGPEYVRRELQISSLLAPDMTHIQISLGYYWLGWVWGSGYDYLTPAPYYDNVALKAYTIGGPALTAHVIYQAQDAFPQSGSVNWDDLSQNSVRFDMARNISPPLHQRNDPGDSLVIDAVAVRTGAVLTGPPQMHWRLLANPLFDPYRTSSPAHPVVGDSVYTAAGTLVEDRWSFDLPDSGFLFPGDVIRYYFVAQDDAGGNVGASLLPADTTGYSHLPGPDSQVTSVYPCEFTQRALPTMFTATEGSQPRILLWYDQAGPEGRNEWAFSLANLGYHEGIEYDMYLTKGAASGVGNGLGGRATLAQVGGYDVILYSSGNLAHYTLGNGDYDDGDAGNDIGLLTAWLMSGSKSLLATGDHLAYDLAHAGSEAEAFLTEILGLGFLADDVQSLVGMQASPPVMPVAGAPVFHPADRWYLYGGCPDLSRYDAVEVTGSAQRLAEFTDPEGLPGMYPYSAATLNEHSAFNAKVVSLPYDLSSVRTPQAGGGLRQPIAARTHLLDDVLTFFGQAGTAPTDIPDAEVLVTRTYPNPFNPRVTVEYRAPYRDRLTVRVYNLRGYLVKTLLDERVEAGPGRVVWDGTDEGGAAAASGVYFVDIRQGEQRRLHKLALVR